MKRFILNLASMGLSLAVAIHVQAAAPKGGSTGGNAAPKVSNASVGSGRINIGNTGISLPKTSTLPMSNANNGQPKNTGIFNPNITKIGQTGGQNQSRPILTNVQPKTTTTQNGQPKFNPMTTQQNKVGQNNGIQTAKVGIPKVQANHNVSPKLAKAMRTTFHNTSYHAQCGTRCDYGYCYRGNNHCHWSYCYFDHRYNCNLYYCPCTYVYYYWCPADVCYYPVNYCPHQTYCDCTTVIDTSCPVVPYDVVTDPYVPE